MYFSARPLIFCLFLVVSCGAWFKPKVKIQKDIQEAYYECKSNFTDYFGCMKDGFKESRNEDWEYIAKHIGEFHQHAEQCLIMSGCNTEVTVCEALEHLLTYLAENVSPLVKRFVLKGVNVPEKIQEIVEHCKDCQSGTGVCADLRQRARNAVIDPKHKKMAKCLYRKVVAPEVEKSIKEHTGITDYQITQFNCSAEFEAWDDIEKHWPTVKAAIREKVEIFLQLKECQRYGNEMANPEEAKDCIMEKYHEDFPLLGRYCDQRDTCFDSKLSDKCRTDGKLIRSGVCKMGKKMLTKVKEGLYLKAFRRWRNTPRRWTKPYPYGPTPYNILEGCINFRTLEGHKKKIIQEVKNCAKESDVELPSRFWQWEDKINRFRIDQVARHIIPSGRDQTIKATHVKDFIDRLDMLIQMWPQDCDICQLESLPDVEELFYTGIAIAFET